MYAFWSQWRGKSTLVNTLAPMLNIKTKAISEQHQQGQHTTTHANCMRLDFGAKIIDTPGIRGFGMIAFSPQELRIILLNFLIVKANANSTTVCT